MRLFRFILLFVAVLLSPPPLYADQADIAAASRSVVRVVLVARDGNRVFYVGHGSGVAISPNTIITNAHVIEPARSEDGIVIGIIPSEGETSYGGQILAYSPGNDLALIRLESGRLPPAALFTNAVSDGTAITAIGYPGAVDRAQGLAIGDLIAPMAPVKTPGVISGGRSSRDFQTLLHTAPIARGNSGGPIVDSCGRIIGINSFGSLSDGNEAEFGFAISNREISAFLRAANITPQLTSSPCRTSDELSREKASQSLVEFEKSTLARITRDHAERDRLKLAERTISQQLAEEREEHLFVAGLLLIFGLAAGGAAMTGPFMTAARRKLLIGIGLLLTIGAAWAHITRPAYSEFDDRLDAFLNNSSGQGDQQTQAGSALTGPLICTLNRDRSRITVSNLTEVTLDWQGNGCVNGRTQYGREGSSWARILVPNNEQTISINRYEPATNRFIVERYLVSLSTMDKARNVRGALQGGQCTTNKTALADLEDMQKNLRQSLPGQPNEILIFQCSPTVSIGD